MTLAADQELIIELFHLISVPPARFFNTPEEFPDHVFRLVNQLLSLVSSLNVYVKIIIIEQKKGKLFDIKITQCKVECNNLQHFLVPCFSISHLLS